MIYCIVGNGNRTEWSQIQSVYVLIMSDKQNRMRAELFHSCHNRFSTGLQCNYIIKIIGRKLVFSANHFKLCTKNLSGAYFARKN